MKLCERGANPRREFADGMSEHREGIPDSEQIEPTVAEPLMRNSVSVEQIQDTDLR